MNSKIFKHIIVRDLRVMQSTYYTNIVEGVIFLTVAFIIYATLLPAMGFKHGMIAPLFWGMLILVIAHGTYDSARILATDIAFNPLLKFFITLPISFDWLIARYVISASIQLFFNSLFLFFGGALLFGPPMIRFFPQLLWFFVVYVIIILFFATFSLVAGTVASLDWFRDNMWSRVFVPYIFGGCLYVSWYATYHLSHLLGFLFLASPFTYAIEALRSVILGQEGYLSLRVCLLVLIVLTILNIYLFRKWFIQRVDPVINS
jgi:hypothetical protein